VTQALGSPRDAIDALLVVIAAAQEPPSIAMTDVLYELASEPARQERFLARPELREALIAEALRLRPAASAALRRLTAPFSVGGHVLASGIPFGRGARRCIGEPLARVQLAAVIPTVLSRPRLRTAWPRPERMVVRGTVLVPHRSALAPTSPRSSATYRRHPVSGLCATVGGSNSHWVLRRHSTSIAVASSCKAPSPRSMIASRRRRRVSGAGWPVEASRSTNFPSRSTVKSAPSGLRASVNPSV
jgi:hypothetical protein